MGAAVLVPSIVAALAATSAAVESNQQVQHSKGASQAAAAEQQAQGSAIQTQLAQQPKQITPDNFLSMKAGQLANLKLGLASTVTGAGGAPSAVLGSTSLQATGTGKTKLGS